MQGSVCEFMCVHNHMQAYSVSVKLNVFLRLCLCLQCVCNCVHIRDLYVHKVQLCDKHKRMYFTLVCIFICFSFVCVCVRACECVCVHVWSVCNFLNAYAKFS